MTLENLNGIEQQNINNYVQRFRITISYGINYKKNRAKHQP